MKTVDETWGQLPLPTSFITVTVKRDESEGRSSSDSDSCRIESLEASVKLSGTEKDDF